MASPKSEQKGDEANHSILARSLGPPPAPSIPPRHHNERRRRRGKKPWRSDGAFEFAATPRRAADVSHSRKVGRFHDGRHILVAFFSRRGRMGMVGG